MEDEKMSVTMNEPGLEKRVINYLKKHPEGIMIIDLAAALGSHRHTLTKYIYRLEGMGLLRVRKVGIAKLCYLKGGVRK